MMILPAAIGVGLIIILWVISFGAFSSTDLALQNYDDHISTREEGASLVSYYTAFIYAQRADTL
jgi:hypothetical protein